MVHLACVRRKRMERNVGHNKNRREWQRHGIEVVRGTQRGEGREQARHAPVWCRRKNKAEKTECLKWTNPGICAKLNPYEK